MKICDKCLRLKKVPRNQTICGDCQILRYIADKKEYDLRKNSSPANLVKKKEEG